MKKEFKKGILLVTMLATMISYATDLSFLEIKNDIKKTVLSLNIVKQGQQLLIKDVYGIILYKEQIKKSGTYHKEFDLTTLPNGNYFFELEKELETQIIPFTVSFGNVEFIKEREVHFFKPFVRFKDHKILLSRLSIDNKPLTVQIYYNSDDGFSNDELIFSENIENTSIVERVYSFLKDKKGDYTIIMKVDDRTFSETFSF
ncbi:MAG: hypothetical protein KDC67_06800 [Ignavibacteriae bacterium]|nr:hypothetical protein [Ignavibacteriota bacterium]